MLEEPKKENAFTGTLLVVGTCMGGGMLAMPLRTGPAGPYPCLLINFICWLVMLATGLLLVEVALWLPDCPNLLSMFKELLGPIGMFLGALFFLFFYYSLLTSYFDGITSALQRHLSLEFPQIAWSPHFIQILLSVVFCLILLLGTATVNRLNFVLIIGLFASFFILVFLGQAKIQLSRLGRQEWGLFFAGTSLIVATFSYHDILPQLITRLKQKNTLRRALIGGTTISFLIYGVWQWIIIGLIPETTLEVTESQSLPISLVFTEIFERPWLYYVVDYFTIFAIFTSILRISILMIDFLGERLRIKRNGTDQFFLCLFTVIVPLLFVWNHPRIFVNVLGYAGAFGGVVLNIVFPIAMVWVGRYKMKKEGKPLLFGGRTMLALLFIFAVIVISFEIFRILGTF